MSAHVDRVLLRAHYRAQHEHAEALDDVDRVGRHLSHALERATRTRAELDALTAELTTRDLQPLEATR